MSSRVPNHAAQLVELRAEAGREREAIFGREALLWLAVVPLWSEPLALASGFPSKLPVAEFAVEAERAGLCETARSPDRSGSTQLQFWMPDSVREQVLREFGTTELRQEVRTIAARVKESLDGGVEAGASVIAWVGVALQEAPGMPGGEALNARIQGLAGAGETGRALDLIDAVNSLAPVVGGELESIAARGTRRVNLEYRRKHNERALRTFTRRAEQLDAFDRLLHGRLVAEKPGDRVWALHYVGMGGVGKTMLIRYLTTRFAAEHELPEFPVARIDFDHVSPSYPGERPGQLLLELADELAPHAVSRVQDTLLGNLARQVTSLHEFAAERRRAVDLDSPPYVDAIDAFRLLIEALPQPVVMFFDTCEELAKLSQPGQEAPGITATFAMLEAVQAQVPTVRVVFAGRRLLAASGPGWSTRADGSAQAVSVRHRPFLAIREIRGFTEDEADRYLAQTRGHVVRPGVRAALLERCVETGRIDGLKLDRAYLDGPDVADSSSDGRSIKRYNPYDLALHANLLDERPDLDEQTIRASETDLYVRLRILERLRDEPELLDALPVLSFLGRFDLATLQAALARPARDLFERAAEQEWTQESFDRELGVEFLEIQPRLRARLIAHYERTDPLRLASLRSEVAGRLRELLAERPLRELRADQIEAALQLFDGGDGARLWSALAQRIAADEAWAWAHGVCDRLLALEGVAGDPASPLAAGVRATHVGALIHERDGFDPLPHWKAIEASAAVYGDPAGAIELRDRAVLGRLACEVRLGGAPDPERLATLKRRLKDPVASVDGAVATALEAVLDVLDDAPAADVVQRWATSGPPPGTRLAAFARCQEARVHAREGRFGPALLAFTQAGGAVAGGDERELWNDWVSPADPLSRIRLEHLRIRGLRIEQEILYEWLDKALLDLDLRTIDAERLTSALVERLLEHEPVDPRLLEDLEVPEYYVVARRAECAAHTSAPPLFVSIARGWLAAGDGARALAVLERRERKALGSRLDGATVRAAQLASLDVARRLRLRTPLQQSISPESVPEDPELTRLALAVRATGTLVDGRTWPTPGDSLAFHDWWSTVTAQTPEDATAALDAIESVTTYPMTSLAAAEFHLDRCEAAAINGRTGGRAGRFPTIDARVAYEQSWERAVGDSIERTSIRTEFDGIDSIREIWTAERDRELGGLTTAAPQRWARLCLRAYALSTARPDVRAKILAELSQLPSRLLAQLAFEEGELMALRVPSQAAELLQLAGSRYDDASDPAGAAVSAILAALTLTRANELTEALREFESRALPGYQSLIAALDPRGQEVWREWGRRLEACGDLIAGVAAAASADTGGEFTVPPPRPAAPSLRSSVRSVGGGMLAFGGGVLAGLFVAGVLLLCGWALHGVLGAVDAPLDPGFWLDIPLAVVILGLLTAFAALTEHTMRSSIRRWLELQITIDDAFAAPVSEADGPAVERVTATITLRSRAHRLGYFSLYLRLLASPASFVLSRGATGCLDATVGGTIERSIGRPLALIAKRTRRSRLTVALRVVDGLADRPWERIILAAIDQPESALQTSFAFRRIIDAVSPPPRRPGSSPRVTIGIIGTQLWAPLAHAAWQRRPVETGAPIRVESLDPAPETSAQREVTLLHLVGSPSITYATSGWTLRVDARSAGLELGMTLSASAATPQAQMLLTPDRLPAVVQHLVVVQDEPEAVTGDQLRANGLRAFGSVVARTAGVPVITVPALPPEIAAGAIEALAQDWRAEAGPDALAALVASVQARIVEEASGKELPLSPVALAFEVTLFVPEIRDRSSESQTTT